ncbi:MAG: hypothetical protein NUV54_02650, partial [Candidatus Taylorbacteria bacterium]|nr:hypothetical protein [Candidatus Taylorbacteria bacterium]
MRYVASPSVLHTWFENLKKRSEVSWSTLALISGVTGRTLHEWRLGNSTIPADFVVFVRRRFKVGPLKGVKIHDFWSRVQSGRVGGLRRIALYGNPGTASGRSLGGLRSLATHKKKLSSPFNARKIFLPQLCPDLAEFVGIVLGDGGIQKRQIIITLHKEDDKAYSRYVVRLINKLFRVKPSIVPRSGKKAVDIILSRVASVQFLQSKGLFVGDKVKRQVDVPKWIKESKTFESSCLRGLFDTDGCFYVDKHVIKGKVYLNCGMNFTNHSLPLLYFFKQTLTERGYHPTQRTKFSVFLRREDEIIRYLE